MGERLICFLYDHFNKIKHTSAAIRHLQKNFVVIEFSNTDHLLEICSTLIPSRRGFILAHAGVSEKTNSNYEANSIHEELRHLDFRLPEIAKKIKQYSTGTGSEYLTTIIGIESNISEKNIFFVSEINNMQKDLKKIDSFILSKGKFDWSSRRLLEKIKEDTLKYVIGELIGEEHSDYILTIINPGHSGAILLKIDYRKNNLEKFKSKLVKLSQSESDLKSEQEAAAIFEIEGLNNQKFISALRGNHDNKVSIIKGWYCLIFSFQENKITLRNYLKKNINTEISFIPVLKDKVIESFQEFNRIFKNQNGSHIKMNLGIRPITSGKQDQYRGLNLKFSQATAVRQTVERLKNIYGEANFLSAIYGQEKTAKEQFNFFTDFLNRMPEQASYKTYSLEKEVSPRLKVPLAVVHGDFHTANVMISKQGDEPVFIDFANTTIEQPFKHAFLDIGKLSTDLEISIIPDYKLIDDPIFLSTWMEHHSAWTHNENYKPSSDNALSKIYSGNTYLRQYLIKEFGEMMEEEDIIRQFYMVRLHYFLKAISYNYEIREKLFFFIRASIDILEYLTKDKS